MLALGILVVALLGVAGPLTCDSGGVARAEDARPVPASDRLVPAQDRKTARGRPVHERVDYMYPPPLGEQQRGPLRGDFWTPNDLDRAFQDFDRFQGFERIVPPER